MPLFKRGPIPGSGTGIKNTTFAQPLQFSAPPTVEFSSLGGDPLVIQTPWAQHGNPGLTMPIQPYSDVYIGNFLPGPGPGPGMHAKPYRLPSGAAAPKQAITSMQASPGQSVTAIPIDDLQWKNQGYNNGGLGAWLNAMATVQTVLVQQPAQALQPPNTLRSRGWFQPTETGRADRYPSGTFLHAPRKLQSVPGYVITQQQVQYSHVNANLGPLYNNLRAPGVNESQGGMCS